MAAGLNSVRERIAAAAQRVGRDPSAVRLVVVTKDAPDAAVQGLYQAGERHFGENRAAALATRAVALPDDVRWHLIGRLQGNKVRRVRPLVHLLHSLDRADLAGYWAAPGLPAPPVLVEVNVSGEPQKAGVAPEETAALVEAAVELGLDAVGLMTVAPATTDPESVRPHFAALRRLRDQLVPGHPGLIELSMGMSDDFEVAVEEGATILRVGRAIFSSYPEEG
ncbi:MAG TPA: YggS family pyridoxal phosphate-dependent enzyme [Acidimicrobiia bacterium]|nr:YggS family pyridoxal phosphate-dependent enzyme [Acidimicrobiia bacterium]